MYVCVYIYVYIYIYIYTHMYKDATVAAGARTRELDQEDPNWPGDAAWTPWNVTYVGAGARYNIIYRIIIYY